MMRSHAPDRRGGLAVMSDVHPAIGPSEADGQNMPELDIQENATAMQMANAIFGDGVQVVNANYDGWSQSSGIYTGGLTTSPGVVPGDTGVILSTGRASHFTQSGGDPNRSTGTSTNTRGDNNNPLFNAAAGTNTYDASYLEVDFIPTGDTMTMQFVFSSEEYPEYTTSQFQDLFGVWINGTLVPLSVGDGGVDPGNVNPGSNSNLFIDNTGDAYNTEMDGFTVTMTLTIPVNSGVLNSIMIGIADVSDSNYDSNVLIAGDSVQTVLVAQDDTAYLNDDGSTTVDVLGNDINANGGTLTITHINGQAVTAGSTVTLNTGQTVQLNGDGTITVVGDNDGTDETFNFTYTITDGTNTDTGFVNAIPCFVAGTLIETGDGPRPVEELQPGDLVLSRDHGPVPLRWTGQRTVEAAGALAPILFHRNALGRHAPLAVSPQHRMLVRDPMAELMFSDPEVLVAARHLVNGSTIVQVEGGPVTYVHLLFDEHQIVYGNGIPSESFLPGPAIRSMFERAVLDEICLLFPEFEPETGAGYGPAARRILKAHETAALTAQIGHAA